MNPLSHPPKGLKDPFILETDYRVGGVSGVTYEEVNPSGDWSGYLPTREPQKYKFDTNECSTISATKCLEIQFNFFLKTGKFGAEFVQWLTNNGYIDENGNINFSERFSGIMAGTSINGNSQSYVWESIRKAGLLPQRDLGYSPEQSQKFLTQYDMGEDYYDPNAVTDVMRAKAKLIFRYITIQYEWVWANAAASCPKDLIRAALKQAPVQVGTPACPDWNTGSVHPCGDTAAEHATTIYNEQSDDTLNDFDHYNPYLKTLSPDYFIPYAIKPVVTVNTVSGEPTVSYSVIQQLIDILKRIGEWTAKAVNGLSYA